MRTFEAANRQGAAISHYNGKKPKTFRKGELAQEAAETKGGTVVICRGNLPIDNTNKNINKEGKRADYIQNNHLVRKLTASIRNNYIKNQFSFMTDFKSLISKTATDLELTRVRNSVRREDEETVTIGS